MTMKSLKLSFRNIWYMIKIGLPTFVAELSMGIMMVTGNYMFLSYLGEDGLWLAISVAELITLIIIVSVYLYDRSRMRNVR